MKLRFRILALGALFVSGIAAAQAPPLWHDDFVDHMAGAWKMEGDVKGRPAHHELQAEWVLNHQFLCVREKTVPDAPATESRYEATWFLGYEEISERYVLHLFDVFGTRYSETLGYGSRDGDAIRFVFEYPDGPFHTTFRWLAEKQSWQWAMEQKDKDGKWTPFADFRLTRVAKP